MGISGREWRGKEKERAKEWVLVRPWQSATMAEEKETMVTCSVPRSVKATLYRECLTLDHPVWRGQKP